MKKTILILLLLCSLSIFGQVQKFPQFGFQVQCGCELNDNKVFKTMSKGKVDVFASLVCNENNKTIYNLNVYKDISGSSEIFNRHYIRNLKESNINYSLVSVSGIKSIEYTFSQGNLPTRAVVFYNNGKSYLLQVGTTENLNSSFNTFKNSFKFIK